MRSIRILLLAEPQGLHIKLREHLDSHFTTVAQCESIVDGLSELQHRFHDVIIISCDISDAYLLQDTLRIISEAQQQVILVSQQGRIEGTFPEVSACLNLQDENAFDELLRVLKEAEASKDAEFARTMLSADAMVSEDTPLADSIPLGLYRIRPNGDIIECSSTLVELFGSPNAETVLGENFFTMFCDLQDAENWQGIISRDYELRGLVYCIEQHSGDSIWVRDTARAVFSPSGEISSYVGALEDVTKQKFYEHSLSFLKTHDILTGLPNKTFFLDQARLTISQARYSGDVAAFLTVDLGDTSGELAVSGTKKQNMVLQQAAQRIKKSLRKSDHVARLEGSSFIVMLHSLRSRKDILTVAEKLTQICSTQFTADQSSFTLFASIGISIHPDHGDEIEVLLNRSKIAALTARDREQGGYMIYSDTIHIRNGATDS